MRKGYLFVGALLLTLSLGLVACGGGSASKPTATPTKAAATPTKAATTPSGGGEVVQVTLTDAPKYTFVPDKLSFQSGKTYTLQFNAPKEFHTFTVGALGIDIFINPNEAVKADITPGKAGTFKLICIPHEGLGMIGEVTVS
ncbi:MAG: cupredoxin domain-containing protein [Chloroflexi bacterium]|nr:cupredoxin domain-containing protein [Chloroflexota bacterium]